MSLVTFSAVIGEIGGSEWIIIILLSLVLIFGTKRLPQFSKMAGRAVGEYEKARNLIRQEMSRGLTSGINVDIIPRITGPVANERQKLEQMALTLGIDYSGKSDDELRHLIAEKISR